MSSPCVAVAYSGGRDSTALLHATALAAARLHIRVHALHVHHGLSPDADDWLLHAQAQCAQWAADGLPVQLSYARLTGRPKPGESIEAWARRERYAALCQMAKANGATLVLLAHHQRDQVETFLLQALRGGGVAGLASMPRRVERDGLMWGRPWLTRSRSDIDTYVRTHGLDYVDDGSNADVRFARNRLRLQVWPALCAAFPDAHKTLAASAQWAAQAQDVLNEVARQDLAGALGAKGLLRSRWLALSEGRRGLVLKQWLLDQTGQLPPASLLTRLQAQWPDAGEAQWPVAGGVLRNHRGCLSFVPAGPSKTAGARTSPADVGLSITRAGAYDLPEWGGVLRVRRVKDGGVPLAFLAHALVRGRRGGEQFQAAPGRPPRSLKKQFQSVDVPVWQRGGPLVYSGGQLIFVPGLGIDARVLGLPGQKLVHLAWEPSVHA